MNRFIFYVLIAITGYIAFNVCNNNSKATVGAKTAVETKKAFGVLSTNVKDFVIEVNK
jgi:hypothetical protein